MSVILNSALIWLSEGGVRNVAYVFIPVFVVVFIFVFVFMSSYICITATSAQVKGFWLNETRIEVVGLLLLVSTYISVTHDQEEQLTKQAPNVCKLLGSICIYRDIFWCNLCCCRKICSVTIDAVLCYKTCVVAIYVLFMWRKIRQIFFRSCSFPAIFGPIRADIRAACTFETIQRTCSYWLQLGQWTSHLLPVKEYS